LTERGYLNDQQNVTIEIEFFFSHLMYLPDYSPLDDIVRKQKQQIMYVQRTTDQSIDSLVFCRRELLAAQSENFQLEKKLHEVQMSLHNPGMANRLSDMGNGMAMNSSAPSTPHVVRKYYEMKYGDKSNGPNLTPTGNPSASSSSSMFNHATSFDAGSAAMNPMAARNGTLPSKGASSSVPQPNVLPGARGNTPFKFPTKLPDSIQTTLANTSQTLQSKLPASLQKLPTSLTQGPTINMLASKLQNAFS
jgi:hypothetical protein